MANSKPSTPSKMLARRIAGRARAAAAMLRRKNTNNTVLAHFLPMVINFVSAKTISKVRTSSAICCAGVIRCGSVVKWAIVQLIRDTNREA